MSDFWDELEPSTPTRVVSKTRRRSPVSSRTAKRHVTWFKPTTFTDSSPPTFHHSPSLPLSLDSPAVTELDIHPGVSATSFDYAEMAKSLQEILSDITKSPIVLGQSLVLRPTTRGAKRNHQGDVKPMKRKRSSPTYTATIQVGFLSSSRQITADHDILQDLPNEIILQIFNDRTYCVSRLLLDLTFDRSSRPLWVLS